MSSHPHRARPHRSTFPGTEMPPIESYTPGSVCPQLGGSCSKLAYWLQVRGTMCGEPEWKPHFTKGRLSEASENAAYAAALDRGNSCAGKANGPTTQVLAQAFEPSQPSEFFFFARCRLVFRCTSFLLRAPCDVTRNCVCVGFDWLVALALF